MSDSDHPEYHDPNMITADVAGEMVMAWTAEYERLAGQFYESLTPEQEALRTAMVSANNERTIARAWQSWRLGDTKFMRSSRALPRFPGQARQRGFVNPRKQG